MDNSGKEYRHSAKNLQEVAGTKKERLVNMGTLRLLLVLIVVIYHARRLVPLPTLPLLPIPDGHEALWIFFTMSGFYMALILNEKYPANQNRLFYLNRWLRIWPMYLGALALLALFVAKTGVICAMQCMDLSFAGQILSQLPASWLTAIGLSNLFMIGLDAQWVLSFLPHDTFGHGELVARLTPWPNPQLNGPLFTLINPAWSLAIELVFYLLAPFLLRSIGRTLAVFIAALGLHLYFGPSNHYFIFFFAPSVYLFFMAGALTWQISQHYAGWYTRRSYQLYALLWCLALWQLGHLWPQTEAAHPIGWHSYLKIIGFLPFMPVLFHLTARSRIDRFCADVSYPVFILHGPIFIYAFHLWPQASPASLMVGIIAASLTAGLLGYGLIERPVGKWRDLWTSEKLARLRLKQMT